MVPGWPLNHGSTYLGIASKFTQTKIELAIEIIRLLAFENAGIVTPINSSF
jgi:hypothetical protein